MKVEGCIPCATPSILCPTHDLPPAAAPMIDHTPPSDFPAHHFTGIAVPAGFARVIVDAAAKAGTDFEGQLLKWAQMGAECSRLHQPKKFKSGRTK